jgi:hypothetical protein
VCRIYYNNYYRLDSVDYIWDTSFFLIPSSKDGEKISILTAYVNGLPPSIETPVKQKGDVKAGLSKI